MIQIDHPSHYNQGSIECIDAMVAAFGASAVKHFCTANAFKYIWRAGRKNEGASELADLQKARWYLDKAIELIDINNQFKSK